MCCVLHRYPILYIYSLLCTFLLSAKLEAQKPHCLLSCQFLRGKVSESETKRESEKGFCFICMALLRLSLSAISHPSTHLLCPLISPTISFSSFRSSAASVPFIKGLTPLYRSVFGVNARVSCFPVSFSLLSSHCLSLCPHLFTHSPSLSAHQPPCLPS